MCRVGCTTGAFAGFCWHNLQCKVVTVFVHTIYDGMADGIVRVPVAQGVGIGAQLFHPCNDDQQHDDGEWYRRDNDQRLQRSEEHTSELQSRGHLVCRLLLEKKNQNVLENKTMVNEANTSPR